MKITTTNLFGVSKGLLLGLGKAPALPVTHITASILAGTREAAVLARADHIAAMQATRLSTRKQNEVKLECIEFAGHCRTVLAPFLGSKYDSTTWPTAGWSKGTLAVPRSVQALIDLYTDLHKCLEDNPAYSSTVHKVTPATVKERLDDLEECFASARDARSNQRKRSTARKKADGTLLKQSRGLVSELELILAADDVRWMDFVAAVPADPRRPEPVDVIVVTGGGPGELEVDWERSVRSTRFYVEVLVPGPGAAFRRFATVKDTNASLKELPPEAEVQVRVVAVNEAGESAPSDAVTIRVPALADAA